MSASIYRPAGRLVWMLRWRSGGRLVRISTGTRVEAEARAILESKRRELAETLRRYTVVCMEGTRPVLRHTEATSADEAARSHPGAHLVLAGHQGNIYRGETTAADTLLLKAFPARYGDHYCLTQDAALRASRERAWARSRSCIVGACEFFQKAGAKGVHEVTRALCVRFRESLRGRVQDSTANKYHRECSAAWTWAVDSGYAGVNPWIGLAKLKVATKDPVVLSAEEWRAVIAGSEDHALHGVICTALYAGLRNAEICRLRWEDVDFPGRVIRVACDGERVTKSRLGRTVPLAPALSSVLRPGGVRGYVFTRKPLLQWTPETLSSAVSEVSRMVGVRFGLQVLRRTFASVCVQDLGISQNRVQEYCGHASIDTTRRYYIERRSGFGDEADLIKFEDVHGSKILPPFVTTPDS